MPQLSQIGEIYASQLFWLAIVFALIYFGIGKAMVPRIERTIDDRNARISGDLNAAEVARDSAASLEVEYHTTVDAARAKAQAAMIEARTRATSASEASAKTGDARMSAEIDQAMVRIDAARAKALGDIEAMTADTVEQIVAKLSGVSIDRAFVETKVKAELANG